jgi:hypothetical protein
MEPIKAPTEAIAALVENDDGITKPDTAKPKAVTAKYFTAYC